MNRARISVESERAWVEEYSRSGCSLRTFVQSRAGSPSVSTLSRRMKQLRNGEQPGAGRGVPTSLSPSV